MSAPHGNARLAVPEPWAAGGTVRQVGLDGGPRVSAVVAGLEAPLLTATNVRLREAIAAGKLREDLYYRLNVLSIHLPPLRERDGDVQVLDHFLHCELQRELHGFVPTAMSRPRLSLAGQCARADRDDRRAVVLANGPLIEAADLRLEPVRLPPRLPAGAAEAAGAQRPRRESCRGRRAGSGAERDAILQAIEESRFNMTRAARSLGVSRATFYRMLQRNRIELAQQFRVPGRRTGRGEDWHGRRRPVRPPMRNNRLSSRETLSQQRKRREEPSISPRVNNKTGRNLMLCPPGCSIRKWHANCSFHRLGATGETARPLGIISRPAPDD